MKVEIMRYKCPNYEIEICWNLFFHVFLEIETNKGTWKDYPAQTVYFSISSQVINTQEKNF